MDENEKILLENFEETQKYIRRPSPVFFGLTRRGDDEEFKCSCRKIPNRPDKDKTPTEILYDIYADLDK